MGCNRKGSRTQEAGYVSAPQVVLRDRVAAVYNKVGVVKNGDRVEVLEHSRNGRFVRVRAGVNEGWMEQRYLVSEQVFGGFEQLARSHAATPVAAHALTRAELNMHLTPTRDGEKLFQMAQGEKVELLERASTPKPSPPQATAASPVAAKPGAKKAAAPVGSLFEDWWLARDVQGHAGWVLGRMLDVDIPLEVAQYAEGQRIVACFVLNEVRDGDKKIPQYLVLLSEPRDGLPFDYNQARVFTWNPKRSHYETAYRERKLNGVLPVRVTKEPFGKEGTLPAFTLRVKNDDGSAEERKYKLNGVMVRRVTAAGEAAPRAKGKRKR